MAKTPNAPGNLAVMRVGRQGVTTTRTPDAGTIVVSGRSPAVIVTDSTAPSVPQSLTATAVSTSQINLSWSASTDTGGSGLAGYRIYRDGSGTPLIQQAGTTFSDTGLAATTSYSYRVTAYDNQGNESALSSQASATTQSIPVGFNFYISPTGNNSNNGTSTSTPWALSALGSKGATYAGFTIGLMDGTYDMSGVTPAQGGQDNVYNLANGSAASPTILRAVNAQQAIIKGNNGSTFPHSDGGLIGTTSGAANVYVTIDGLKFTGAGAMSCVLGNVGNSVNGVNTRSNGIVVKNCEFTGMDTRTNAALHPGGNVGPIKCYGLNGAQFINNYFHDNIGASGPGSNDHFSDVVMFQCDNNLFEYCTVVNSGGLFGKASPCKGTIIRYCFLDLAGYDGNNRVINDFNTAGSTGTFKVHNNVIRGPMNDLRPTSGGAGGSTDFQWFNNTVITTASTASFSVIGVFPAGVAKIYNNINESAATGDNTFLTLNVNADGLIDYNLYHSTGQPKWGSYPSNNDGSGRSGYDTLAQFISAMGAGVEAHSGALNGLNPQFAGSGAGPLAFQLQSGSPAKNAGRSDGTTSGTICDLGAYGNLPVGVTHLGHSF